ncbi:PGF-CTERM-anchored ABC transporter substrate-binding protein [Halomarina salina]|uniref:PGF-CTERM-anchored ABC transporter substrate-binding protein n=1 Tax=Halomarina salina TaxID=1872699 RepID=A0ABD5RHQ1_9EURY|nr:PGF-CTERM-anchored ABC transporter substrate-binding protein [Halomarina salina]
MRQPRHTVLVVAVLVGLLVGAVPAAAVSTGPTATDDAAVSPAQVESSVQAQCSFPATLTDGTGTEVTVEQRPDRIVALQASTAQILWEVGAQERVVGMPVRSYTSYLNGSDAKTDVLTEDGAGVNVEQVVALEPDLVLAPSSIGNETVEQLRNAGLTVYKSGADKSIESIYEKTDRYGQMVGNCEEATAVVEETRSAVEEIRSAVEDRDRPRTLYYFYNYTAGSQTFIHEIIETAGGDNVAANAGIDSYEVVNEEVVADSDPEWLLHPSDAPLPTAEPYTSTTALRENQTLTLNANYMNQAAPRVVMPMRKIAMALHPDAFENGTATPTANGTTGTTATPSDGGATTATAVETPTEGATTTTGDGATTTSSGSGPGFGVVGALVASVAAALLARRD